MHGRDSDVGQFRRFLVASPLAPRWIRRTAIGLGIVSALCLLPVAAVLLSIGLAQLGGCTLNEAAVHPCIIAGHDLGHFLYSLSIFVWLMLITGPILMLALAAWIMLGVVALAWRFAPESRRRSVVALTILTVFCLEPIIVMLPNLVFVVLSGGGVNAVLGTMHAKAQSIRVIAPVLLIPVLAWTAFGVTGLIRRPPS